MLTIMISSLLSIAHASPGRISVYCSPTQERSTPTCRVVADVLSKDATAVSVYNTSFNLSTGFATLDITSAASDVRLSAYAAGYAEGFQTAHEIAQFYQNVFEFGPAGPSRKLTEWVQENDAWTRAQAELLHATDDYWLSVATVLDRFDGMLAGYAEAAAQSNLTPLSKLDLLWVNLDGDLFDLQGAIGEPQLYGRLGRAARSFVNGGYNSSRILRCSALFKLAQEDLFFGHATWDTYATAAPRTFKHLALPSRRNGTVSLRTVSMSSSPGFLASIDDYYLVGEPATSTVLGVIETSINIDDRSAYQAITPQSVLCWIRSMVANQLAVDAPGWADSFGLEASGTYNNQVLHITPPISSPEATVHHTSHLPFRPRPSLSPAAIDVSRLQWMVLDVAKARTRTERGLSLLPNTFIVLEEVPGLVHFEDQTALLNEVKYWPSFNVIYYPETRKIAGSRGKYTDSVRYKLFAELQGSVTSDAAMARVIAWNDYQDDPIAQSPSQAIMSRGDLRADGGRVASAELRARSAGGGIDAKYSSVSTAAAVLASYGRAGPTNDDQPAFCWTKEFASTPHVGHPLCFDFAWGTFAPATM